MNIPHLLTIALSPTTPTADAHRALDKLRKVPLHPHEIVAQAHEQYARNKWFEEEYPEEFEDL